MPSIIRNANLRVLLFKVIPSRDLLALALASRLQLVSLSHARVGMTLLAL
jgi:hypothetical protein